MVANASALPAMDLYTPMRFKVWWSRSMKFEPGNFGLSVEGVYLIGYLDKRWNRKYVVYVGQGKIGPSLADNFNKPRIKALIGVPGRVGYYRYCECRDRDERLAIEWCLYRKHGGPELCNEAPPPGANRNWRVILQEEFR